jgi:hypothetical protein
MFGPRGGLAQYLLIKRTFSALKKNGLKLLDVNLLQIQTEERIAS